MRRQAEPLPNLDAITIEVAKTGQVRQSDLRRPGDPKLMSELIRSGTDRSTG